MALTNFEWFKHFIVSSQRFQWNKKSLYAENIKLIFHLNCFTYFSECSLQAVRHGLWGVKCGMWVSWSSIMQQKVRKTFLCQWVVIMWAKQRSNWPVWSSKIKLSISHPTAHRPCPTPCKLHPTNYSLHPYSPQNSQTQMRSVLRQAWTFYLYGWLEQSWI